MGSEGPTLRKHPGIAQESHRDYNSACDPWPEQSAVETRVSGDPMPIRLVVLDIDGVLTRGEAMALDLRLLERLADRGR